MATTADFKNGLCVVYNNELFSIIEFQHVKPGKGGAFVRTKLKNLKTGKIIENTFNSGVKIDLANIERRAYQFSFKDYMGYNFMHCETFELISIQKEMIETPGLLKEGLQVYIVFDADTETPLTCEFPPFVELKVIYTEPGLKGDTASSTALKKATLETNLEIKVPLFISAGEIIKVDTRNLSYSGRVKK
ncbi:MAG: elongation factor P [Bacteroidetes bacterium CG23_combo_of_CG06-09_8_20_14_all_32_9]|nr:MAG: elongation factor P [Bacteroidetes bacterium CG23_combo_of_CG06-09_8_20_14_all_32_9]